MNKLSLNDAKEIAYAKIGMDLTMANRPIILDDATLDFEWGYVFYYNGKKAIETNEEEFSYFGSKPILVDKFDGSAIYVGAINRILDSELEDHRREKGYPASIKFPIKEDIGKLPLMEQVKMLFRTGEISQIKKGIKIVEEKKLFEIENFKKIIFNNAFQDWNFEEQIAAQFNHETVILNNGIGTVFPHEFNIFKDAKELSFSGVELEAVTDSILDLENLEEIKIWYSSIHKITSRVEELTSLKYIEILDSTLGEQANFILKKLEKSGRIMLEDYRK